MSHFRDTMPAADNIGQLKGPLVVFGGPYSNFHAVNALKKHLDGLGYRPNQVICTGDLVAYCAHPVQTVDLIRSWGIHCIQGNVEVQLAANSDDCGCNFVDGSVCDLLSNSWYNFARNQVSIEQRAWMGSLPLHLVFMMSDLTFRVIHGGVTDMARFIFKSTPLSEKRAELDKAGVDVIISGHCGIPFSHRLGPRSAWVNAGVIGMPPNDGVPRLWYATLSEYSGRVVIEHHWLPFDHESAALAMERQRLPQAYAESLRTGLWPSMEILPFAEQSARGSSLTVPPIELSPAVTDSTAGVVA